VTHKDRLGEEQTAAKVKNIGRKEGRDIVAEDIPKLSAPCNDSQKPPKPHSQHQII
jgi:hypothetical protein